MKYEISIYGYEIYSDTFKNLNVMKEGVLIKVYQGSLMGCVRNLYTEYVLGGAA